MFQFAAANGSSLWEKVRLAYHAALKPSLVFRGWARHRANRTLIFRIRTRDERRLEIHLPDDGLGIITLAEFFSARSAIMPADLPAMRPTVIYDLGANVGIASLFLSAQYPGATVYGFEPLPANYEICNLNYRNFTNASQVFPWAVGAQSGTAVFDCQNDPRGGRLESSPHDSNLETVGKIKVRVASVRDLIHHEKLPAPDMVKIDVEGAELDVLRGLEEHQAGVKWIYIETHGAELKRDCLAWLAARGFRVWPGADETAFWGTRC